MRDDQIDRKYEHDTRATGGSPARDFLQAPMGYQAAVDAPYEATNFPNNKPYGGQMSPGVINEENGSVNMNPAGCPFDRGNALKAVSEAMAFGRRLHGLLPGAQQEATNRMPTVPGSPSESGRREQPAPGPLPPTQNPFGKRAEAPQEAIETGEEPEAEDDEEMA